MKKTMTSVILLLSLLVTFAQPLSAAPQTREISQAVADQIMVDGQVPAVVFSVDKKGNVQAFRVEGTTSKLFNFPLPAETIQSMKTFTIFETTNPKTCWINALGILECIEW